MGVCVKVREQHAPMGCPNSFRILAWQLPLDTPPCRARTRTGGGRERENTERQRVSVIHAVVKTPG
eukprot:COSAG01_NODE_5384_length_4294_cov_1.988796_1_plen_65_part_10